MINGFIMQKSDMIDLDKVENLINLENITTEIAESVKNSNDCVKDTINAIEKYNRDHKLPADKRLTYWVTVNGNPTLLHVFHTEFRNNFAEITYFIRSGTIDAKFDSNNNTAQPKLTSVKQGLITMVVPTSNIFAVSFGSYNTNTAGPILENKLGDETKISNIEIELRKEMSVLNTLAASGKTRDYIIHFNSFFNKPGYNDIKNYNYNREAYNLYVTLWKNYINFVENIIDSIEADTVETPVIGLFTNANGVEQSENYKKILQ